MRGRAIGWLVLGVLGVAAPPAAAAPDIGLTFTAAPEPATVGQPLTFTLTATNRGDAATGVQLVAGVPVTMTFVSVDDARCTAEVRCTIGALAAGASVTVKFVVTPGSAGTASSTAEASSTEGGTAPSATANVTIVAPRTKPTLTLEVVDGLVGQPLSAGYRLSGGTGPVMLTLYGPDDEDCTTPIGTSGFTPTEAGTYRWIAAYSGDAQFEPVSTSCTPVPVRAVPRLNVGSTGVELTGAVAGSGTLTFTACPGGSVAVPVAGNGLYAAPIPAPYSVAYSGDERNAPVSSVCPVPVDVGPPVVLPVTLPPPPSNAFVVRKVSGAKSGRITLSLQAPSVGTFRVRATTRGKTYDTARRALTTLRSTTLTLLPNATARKLLSKHSRVSVRVSITFTPLFGAPRTTTQTVTIKSR